MRFKVSRAYVAVAAAVLSCFTSTRALAQTSDYYLSHGEQETLQVVQSGAIVRSWTTAPILYPLAVTDTVKLYDVGNPFTGPAMNSGLQYTLQGVPTGVSYPWQNGPTGQLLDGATDGTAHNYASEFIGQQGIWQFDLNWKNPTLLFSTAISPLGVTYDTLDNSLWISIDGGNIEQVTNNGTIISQFNPGAGRWGSLAWEPATNTLWAHANGTNSLRQWSMTGVFLRDVVITDPAFDPFGTWGGEFAIPVPEPASIWLALTAIILFVYSARLNHNSYLLRLPFLRCGR
jgi:hypothetical protein